MSTDDELLARFRPVLQFDSQESFPADAAATLSDRPGNALKRAGGDVLAGKGSSVPLDVDTLDGTTYPTGAPARAGDYLDATGKDYVAQARAMHREPYADRIHGHAVRDAAGRLWLQYWFFHYYNDKAFLGVGLHEGDWEMIQVRLGADEQPQQATYAQHQGGERCTWDALEHAATPDGPAPVVYSARGSHASYFTRGSYPEAPIVPDHCDGKGPRLRPGLIVISDAAPAWAAWRGRWGSTRARAAWESNSPSGPHEHAQWRDPSAFHEAAHPRPLRVARPGGLGAPPAPKITARREGDHAVIGYRVRPDADGHLPTRIVLSIDGRGDGLPPATETHPIDGPHGSVEHSLALESGRPYDVRASVVSQANLTSETTEASIP